MLPPIRTSDRFSSNLIASPSVPEFHRINPPICRSDGLADSHRRFGFSPTPEHVVLLSILLNAPVPVSFRVGLRRRPGAWPMRARIRGRGMPGVRHRRVRA
ncbi:hypothetical protein GCM10010462_16600 [Microbacterium dextranolyticum]|uniref:Uncharacterized protein n=1 Tax=Microbacterium dextranolyticum TaxID=36806 RepID=A0A9W6HLC8_9MICO|nr:hypothetical protein GCM10017591_09560 [Microbacterium dextranolyticum]